MNKGIFFLLLLNPFLYCMEQDYLCNKKHSQYGTMKNKAMTLHINKNENFLKKDLFDEEDNDFSCNQYIGFPLAVGFGGGFCSWMSTMTILSLCKSDSLMILPFEAACIGCLISGGCAMYKCCNEEDVTTKRVY